MTEHEKELHLDRQRSLAHTVRAVQQFDQYACWAAALEWWSRANGRGRPRLTQLDIMSKYSQYWEQDESKPDYGGMKPQNMLKVLADPIWKMTATPVSGSAFAYPFLCNKLVDGPAFVVYYDLAVKGAHANVIVAPAKPLAHSPEKQFIVMEPNRGRFVLKPARAFGNDNAILGCPD
jgi:hypothetical protein